MAPWAFCGMYLKTGVRTSSTIITSRAASKCLSQSSLSCCNNILHKKIILSVKPF